MQVPFWSIPLLNFVARGFEKLSRWCEERSWDLRHCPCCGENVWYGKSCDDVERRNPRTPDCRKK